MRMRFLLLMAGFSAASCSDTPAPKEQNNLQTNPLRILSQVVPLGMVSASCDGTGDEYELPLILVGDDNTPIRAGETLNGYAPEEILETANLVNTSITEASSVNCAEDTCLNTSFTCLEDECTAPSPVEISGQATFSSSDAPGHLFVVVVENAGSLHGWLPADVGGFYVDWDGDGVAESGPDVVQYSRRASDRTKERVVALSRVLDSWEHVKTHGKTANHIHLYGHWFFSGDTPAGVKSIFEEEPDAQVWTSEKESALRLISETEDPGQSRANVYQAASTVLEGPMAAAEFEDYQKTVLVLVDGPDDLRSTDYDSDRVIQSAKAIGAQVHMVHLDAALETAGLDGTPTLRDDPAYLADQLPCQTDSQCQNFEECRLPIGYASSPNDPVEISDVSYCLPRRDSNGRTGPIHAYQNIACETGGSYQYARSAPALSSRISSLPFATYGTWRVPLTANLGDLESGAYRFSAELNMMVPERSFSVVYGRDGDPAAAADPDSRDNRAVVIKP